MRRLPPVAPLSKLPGSIRLAASVLSIAGTSLVATCRLQDLVNPGRIHTLQLAPATLLDSARAGSLSPRVTKLALQVGTDGVTWSVKSVLGSAWLRPATTTGTTPDTVSVALDPSALGGGVYRDTLVFSVASLAVSPVSVPVEFRVMGCVVTSLVTGTTISDSLIAGDCAAPHRAGRLAKLYSLTGNANDTVSLRLISPAFASYLVLDSAAALAGVPSLAEGASCRAGQSGACLTYVRLPHAGTYEVEATSASGVVTTGPFTLSLTAPRPPVAPDTLTQISSDGLTIVPAGGTVTQDTIGLGARVADPDSDSVRVQIEVRPLGTAFTGAATDTSGWVASGSRALATVTGLANFATYHWQARAVDATGRTSAWVAFAGGTSGFQIVVPQPPHAPASLGQFKSNGTTAIAVGGTTNESTVKFQGLLTDPDTTSQLRLDVEVEPVGTAFTNVATGSSTPVGNGKVATATVANLSDNTAYHWQARAVDQGGHAGSWASFGGNAESETDFAVAIPPSQLAILTQPAADTSGSPVAPAVRVAAQDALGNLLASYTGTISAALASGPLGGTLSGTTSVAAVAGVATFANLVTDKAGTGYTLRFNAGALTTTSSPFATVPGPASVGTSVVTASSGTVASGAAVTLTLQAKDAAGNNLTAGGSTVAFTASGGTSTGVVGATTDVGNGTYTATFTGVASGTATTIHATIGGVAVASTATVTVTPGPVSTSQSVVTTSSGIVASGVAATLTLQAKDAAGNNLTAGGLTVAFTASGGTSTGTISATTDHANGTYTATFTGVAAGTADTIHATIGGVAVTSTLPTIQVTPGTTVSASQTTVVAAPASIAASSGSVTSTITVTAKDAAGNPVAGVMVTLAATGNGNNIVQPVGNTNASGVATGSFSSTAVGSHTVSANAGGVLATQQPTVTVTPAAPASLAFLVQPSNVSAGAVMAPAVQVEVLDAFSNLVTTASGTVSLALTVPNGATLTGGGAATVTNGVATFSGLKVDKVGTYTLTPSTTVSGVTTFPASGSFSVALGTGLLLAFTTQPPATMTAAASFGAVVTVRDSSGNTATGFSGNVSLAIGTNPGGGTLSGTTSVAAVAGVATYSGLTINKVGTGYTLVATATGPASGTSAAFNVTPGAPTQLVWSQQPSNVVAAATMSPAVTVTVEDGQGNVATQASGTVTLGLTGSPAGATLTGGGATAVTSGVATFAGLSVNKVGTYTFTPTTTVGGVTTLPVSGSFTVSAGTATQLAFTTQPSNLGAGGVITPAVVVAVEDAQGNTVPTATNSITVAIGTNPGGGTLSGTATAAAVAGVATFSNLSIDRVGTGYTLTAAATGLTGATSAAFNVTVGGATKLAFTTQPSNVVAGAAIAPAVVVTVQDASGNTVTGATNSITVAIGTNPGGGTLSGTVTVAAVAGVASFSTLNINKTGTGYTLTAAATGLTGATSSAFNVTPGTATKLAFTTQPPSTTAGTAFGVVVTAQDALGNTATSFTGTDTLAIGTNPGGGTLSGTLAVAAVSGVATYSNLSIDKAGAGYTLTAKSGTLTLATSGAFTISTGGVVSASQSTVALSAATLTASGGNVTDTVTVTVKDALGNPIPNVTVVLSATGTANLVQPSSPTDVNGVATGRFSSTAAGTHTITATAGGVTIAQQPVVTVNPTAAAALAFSVQPSNAVSAAAIAPAIQVAVRDTFNNLVTTATNSIFIQLLVNPPGNGVLSGTTTVSAASGVATFSNLSIDKVGTGYALFASTSGLTGAASASFNISFAAAAKLAFSVQPSNVTAAASITPAVQVTVQDAQGNTVTNATNSIAMAIGTNPGGGTLSGTTPVAAVAGVATFANLSINKSGTGYTLAASSTGLTSGTSSTFNVTAGTATQLAWTQQPTAVAAGATMSPAVTVTVEDAQGNAVTTASGTVTLALTVPGGATLTGGGAATVTSGVATFSGLSVNKVGTYTFTPTTTVSGVTTLPASGSFAVSAGAASQLVWTQQPPSTVVAGATMSPAVTVTVEDASGNVVTTASGTVTLALTVPGGATLTGGGAATVTSGVATFAGLSVDKVGTYTFTPTTTVSGVTTLPVSSSFTVSAGAATQLVWTQQPSAVVAGATMSPAVTVTVEDAKGNVVTTASGTVTLALTVPGGATLTGGGAATVTSGVATFAGLSVNKTGTYTFTPSTTVSGVTTLPASGSFAVSAGTATQLVWTQQPSAVVAGATMSPAVTVSVEDAGGNVVTTASGTVTLALTVPGGATLTGGGAATVTSGVATFAGLSVNKVGTYTFTPTTTVTGVTTLPASGSFAVSAGAASQLVWTQQPSAVVAGATMSPAVTVTVEDADGNVVTGASGTVTLALTTASGATLTGGGATSVTSGVATFNGLKVDKVGTYTFTPTTTVSGVTTLPASGSFAVGAGAATQLVWTQQPSAVVAGATMSPAVTVSVEDASGNVVTTASGTVTLGLTGSPGGVTLTGGGAATVTSGVATFAGLSVNKAGTYTFTPTTTVTGVTTLPTSGSFAVSAGTATQLVWTQQPSAVVAGATMAPAVTVTVEDAGGNVVTSASGTVTLALTVPGGATLTGGGATSVASGVATFNGLSVNKVGTYTFTPTTTVSGVTTLPASGSFAVSAGAAKQLVWTQQPTAVAAGATMSPAVTVTVEDANGNVVTSASGTVTLALTVPGGATLTGGGATSVSSGVATFNGLKVDKVGTYTFTPSTTVSGVTTLPASGSFAVSAGAASQLVWTQQPTNVVAGATMSPAVTVTVEDANGNVVTSASGTVTLALTVPGGATLTGGGATSVSSGVATFNGLSVDLATTYTFTPSTTVSGVTTLPASGSFTVSAGTANKLIISTEPSSSATSGVAFLQQPVIQVADQFGNPVASSGVSVAATIATGSGTLGGTTPQLTNASGTATFIDLAITGSGPFTLNFAASGLTNVISTTITLP